LTTTGFGFAIKQLTPDVGRLNSFSRLKSLPAQNLFSSFKALIFMPIIGLILYLVIAPQMPELLNLSGVGLGAGLQQARTLFESLVWRLLAVLLLFGVVDFARQKQKFAKDLRMSKQDIKEEVKQSDGNPQMKAQIRRIQRDRIRKNMIRAVSEANIVIVNPTHFSVAIKYESGSKAVPLVLAKGQDHLALLIRERAREHNIPLVENKPLARALYDAVEVGQEIPPHLYRAVAEVLAHIYKTLHQR
jgi:flagellar biosynthesis protein FlhB